ncbi:hypothetical protein MBLNU459_g5227t1 [Dothideomycetes sp. NU459]
MGWWWSSSQNPSTDVPTTIPDPVVPGRTGEPRPNAPTRQYMLNPKPNREEQADREFNEFLASFENNTPTSAEPKNYERISPAPTETPTHYAPSPSGASPDPTSVSAPAAATADTPLDISPNALYPRTMSCRQAFDQAFYCQSLGGKFNDIYRYGELRSCSDNWSAFWFCMRVRTLGDNERQEAVRDYYEKREDRIKQERGGSSEDIWEMRTEPVKQAFWKDPDAVTMVDKEEA